jgi:hypothetical protein
MKNTIKAVLIAALAAAFLTAEEPTTTAKVSPSAVVKPSEAKSAPLTEAQLLKIENISLKRALLDKQAEEIGAQQNALVRDICAGAKIEVASCSVDPQSKMVRENATTPPVASKK